MKWIEDRHRGRAGVGYLFVISPRGYEYLENLRRKVIDSAQGFCAMWFNPGMTVLWDDAISPAIVNSGYKPQRIDRVHHANRIDDEILAQIRRSKFIVADLSGQRRGVYFEAGFALGLGLTVIWTIRKGTLNRIHFDNRQYPFLEWEANDLGPFAKSLQDRIVALLGQGPISS